MRPVRSLLFAPGNKPEVVRKAFGAGADSVIVDLEDAVPVQEKEDARGVLDNLPSIGVPLVVRVNGPLTEWIWGDLEAAVRAQAMAICVPKAEDRETLLGISGAVSVLEEHFHLPPSSIRLIPIIESAAGVLEAPHIATIERVDALFFGSAERGDLIADLGAEWTPEGTALMHARAGCVLAARAAGHEVVVDGVFMDFRNEEGLRRECLLAKQLGYTAKALIHPAQIATTHEVFTPSTEEVAEAQRILDSYEQALARGDGSIQIDGKMIDYAVAKVAERIVRRSEAATEAAQRTSSNG